MAKVKKSKVDNSSLLARLESVRPGDLSQNKWLEESGVNTSFFTDLRKGTEPGLYKVERLAARAGLTLSELMEGVAARPEMNNIYRWVRRASKEEVDKVLSYASFIANDGEQA